MKNVTLFALAAALTACLSYSSRTVIGADPKEARQRPLALTGKAIVDGCEVTGRLIRKDDGVYAVLDCSNPTDKYAAVQLSYAVHCTPASSPMMRMLPMPSMIHQQRFDCRLAAGEKRATEILVKKEARPETDQPAIRDEPPALLAGALRGGPASWSLAISREEIKGMPGWGGSAPVAIGSEATVLKKGLFVLTRVLEDEANGAS